MVRQFCFMLIFMMLICSRLYSDIVILKDGMILSGKIVEDKIPDYVKIVNTHGPFTVKYSLIEGIYKTENFEDDISILHNLGINASEEDVRINYEAGENILKQQLKKTGVSGPDDSSGINGGLDFFYSRNSGNIKSEIPSSMGISSYLKFSAGFLESAELLKISEIECSMGYLYSAEDQKSIQSIFFSAGPVWNLSHSVRGFDLNWSLSGLMGLGYYSVKNGDRESGGVKWNMTILAGPEYNFSSVTVTPRFRFDYIYDSYAPFISMGLSLGFGRKF